jgi:hypothetical protein
MARPVLAAGLGVRSDACAGITATASLGLDGKSDVVSDEHAPCLLVEFGDETELASGGGSRSV